MNVTEDIINMVADYYNYEVSEVELWSAENIINAYKDILRDLEKYED